MKRATCLLCSVTSLGLLPTTGMVLSVPGCYNPRRWRPPLAQAGRSLTGGLRLELLTAVCPVGSTHACRPQVGVGGQDGRQVGGCSRLFGRRAPLAGCGIALQRQRGSSWEQKSRGTALSVFSKKNGSCQPEVNKHGPVSRPLGACPLRAVAAVRWLLLVLDASKTHSRMSCSVCTHTVLKHWIIPCGQ